MNVSVCVDDVPVAVVPLWMIKHAAEDAVAQYPDQKITLEVSR